ncbi:MAG: hypothetical protein LBP75_00995 [Planctomycetota bacterium]|nr:hypothetical protein [Planctomycetota bacterium]
MKTLFAVFIFTAAAVAAETGATAIFDATILDAEKAIERDGWRDDVLNAENAAENSGGNAAANPANGASPLSSANEPPPANEPPADEAPAAEVNEVADARAAASAEQITAILAVMKRLFAGGNYEAVRQIAETLLDDNANFQPLPPASFPAGDHDLAYRQQRAARQTEREQVRFYHARALFEAALLRGNHRLAPVAAEFARLGDNFWQFENPQTRAESYYYAGLCHDYLTDYPQAIRFFRRAQASEPSIDLSIDNSLALARALQTQAEIVGDRGLIRSPQDAVLSGDDQKRRGDLLKEAEQELTKITSLYSPDRQSNDVDLMLIELRYRLGAYGDVEYQAGEFLKRANPGTEDFAHAAYLLAQAVYQQGKLAEAAKLFNEALAQKFVNQKWRGELAFGLGRVNMRLAQTAGAEMRQTYWARAETSLRQATQWLPFGAAWEDAGREFAGVLLEMREYREADKVLSELLQQPPGAGRVAIYYYAGLAARGLGDYDRAEKYLQTVVELCAARGRELRYALQAINALAELQTARDNPAEALLYYHSAANAAEFLREYDLYAAARLGAALAQAALATKTADQTQAANRRLADGWLDLLAAAQSGNAARLQTATQAVGLRALAIREWENASPANLTTALSALRQLRGRLLARLREDELAYLEGKIVSWQAKLQRGLLVVNGQIKPEDYLPVFALYDRAAEIVDRSIVINPRGAFAAAAHYLLGAIRCAAGDLRREIAREWRANGRHDEALELEKNGAADYLQAVEKLQIAIGAAADDTDLRVVARTLLGNTYLKLADKDHARYYEDGLRELRILVNEPSITAAQRLDAVRGIAAALIGGEQYDEAARLLLAQSSRDLASALDAMKLQLTLGQPRAAYRTLQESVANAERDQPALPLLVEAKFELANLALQRAGQIGADDGEIAALRRGAIDTLADIADRYAGGSWASLALLSLGNFLIDHRQYERALAYADAALRGGERAIVTTQALYLLQGRAWLAWGKDNKDGEMLGRAGAAFVRAERANIGNSPLGRQQRAAAILGQGDVAQARGDDDAALQYYGRVFAIFYQEYEPADLARLQAAAIHERRKNYELAWQILDQGFDQAKLLAAKMRLRELLDAEKRAQGK